MHIASVQFKCFICFRGMLQLFYTDVAKVNRDVAYVFAMVVRTRMLQAPVLNISSILSDVCCKCVYLNVAYVSQHMLQVFYLHVAHVSNGFQVFFASISDTCFKCFISL
jgi:hypothetical protein